MLTSYSAAKIFRFQNLPIELRYRIYDFVIISPNSIRYVGAGADGGKKIGLTLRATCKQIYEETEKFFFRNSFNVDLTSQFKLVPKQVCSKFVEVTTEWWSLAKKDKLMFEFINYNCPKLKVLNLRLTTCPIDVSPHDWRAKRQWSHRDVPEATRFRNAGGFDALVQIRGLERVNVIRGDSVNHDRLKDEEKDAFEAWLNTILTQEKPQPVVGVQKPKPNADDQSSVCPFKNNEDNH
jgi:hypothetical protein